MVWTAGLKHRALCPRLEDLKLDNIVEAGAVAPLKIHQRLQGLAMFLLRSCHGMRHCSLQRLGRVSRQRGAVNFVPPARVTLEQAVPGFAAGEYH